MCEVHAQSEDAEVEDRPDSAMTRSMRQKLGLEAEELTTGAGCRQKKDINVRNSRSKTAGMLWAYRSCGIANNHREMLHAGKLN